MTNEETDLTPIRRQPTITVETALAAISAALEQGRSAGIAVSVAVVDAGMNLVAFAKDDGATPHGAETSRRKANTSASTGKATGWMPADLAATLPAASGNLLTNIPGGTPLRFDGDLGGALGVAGGMPDQDAEVAAVAAAAVGADLAPGT